MPGARVSGSTKPVRAALAALCTSPCSPPLAANAKPRPQGLRIAVLGCITGNSDVAARRGCVKLAGARPEGDSTGLSGVVAMLAGSEGKSLYAVGNSSSILTRLALGPAPGRILFGACLTGNSFVDECTNLPGATGQRVPSLRSRIRRAPRSAPTAASST